MWYLVTRVETIRIKSENPHDAETLARMLLNSPSGDTVDYDVELLDDENYTPHWSGEAYTTPEL